MDVPENQHPVLDTIIVGAGPGGLTTALYLARYRRNILVLDGGASRAALIPATHNCAGFPEGVSGTRLLSRLREQAELHDVTIREARAQAIAFEDGLFLVETGGASMRARTIVLATGVIDLHPDFPGLREETLAGLVRWCPICDGFEVTDKAIAVLGPAGTALGHAIFLRTYSSNITLLATPGQPGLDDDALRKLEAAGIGLVTETVESMQPDETAKRLCVSLSSGKEMTFDALYPMSGSTVQADLATALGARCNEAGDLVVDAHQCSSVPGLYAVGDVVADVNQISVAVGHAAIAATAIHNHLPANFRT